MFKSERSIGLQFRGLIFNRNHYFSQKQLAPFKASNEWLPLKMYISPTGKNVSRGSQLIICADFL